jgi:dienelactone hydrolase
MRLPATLPAVCRRSGAATVVLALIVPVLAVLAPVDAAAELRTETVTYQVGDESFTGTLAYDDVIDGPRPGVLVVHEWWGANDYVRKRAEMLAEEGYTAFALDMYGSGKVAEHPDDARRFSQEVMANRPAAEARFAAALALLRQHPTVDPDAIAAIGYCFGGGIVLHMARIGADLRGVVSFHGSLASTTPVRPGSISSAVMVFTGIDDPFVPAEQVSAFVAEMHNAKAAYTVVGYPGVTHGFTNPVADQLAARFDLPLAYDAAADADSWLRTQVFFDGLFSREETP